jgi:hypothetical protein
LGFGLRFRGVWLEFCDFFLVPSFWHCPKKKQKTLGNSNWHTLFANASTLIIRGICRASRTVVFQVVILQKDKFIISNA